jgi:hypothetical protein
VAFRFLSATARTYPQYRNTQTWETLVAEPGNSYDMQPAQGAGDLSVPPGDGLWAPEDTAGTGDAPAAKDKTAPKGRIAKTAATAAKGESGA